MTTAGIATHEFAGWTPLDPDLSEPACTCGWRGPSEPRTPAHKGSSAASEDFLQHRLQAQLSAGFHVYAAEMVAAALTQAAEAWTGDEEVVAWLQARADHIKVVGRYDGRTWPDEPQDEPS